MFDEPKIRQLVKDNKFTETINSVEKNGWIAFSQVVNNFLSDTKSPEYKEIVKTLLDTYHKLSRIQKKLLKLCFILFTNLVVT